MKSLYSSYCSRTRRSSCGCQRLLGPQRPPPPPGPSPRTPGRSPGPCARRNPPPRRGWVPSVFLRIFPFLSLSPPLPLPPPSLRPRSPGLETPRKSPGHNGAFHGFLHTLHPREGNTGVFLSSAHERERGFDGCSYCFLIYNPEPQVPAGCREREPRNVFPGAEPYA